MRVCALTKVLRKLSSRKRLVALAFIATLILQPAYNYSYDGAKVHVPSGRALIAECVADTASEGVSYLIPCLKANVR